MKGLWRKPGSEVIENTVPIKEMALMRSAEPSHSIKKEHLTRSDGDINGPVIDSLSSAIRHSAGRNGKGLFSVRQQQKRDGGRSGSFYPFPRHPVFSTPRWRIRIKWFLFIIKKFPKNFSHQVY